MKVKYAVIGCGSIARFHFHALEMVKAEVRQIIDIDAKKAAECALRFGAAAGTDYHQALADSAVTAVIVLTPAKFHKSVCIDALAAGKDVICEKTLGATADDAYAIVKARQKTDCLFFTAFMKRFFPAVKKAKELLPALGTIFSIHARSYQPWDNFFTVQDEKDYLWILDKYGGAILKCAGSHIIDEILHFVGRPEYVFAAIDRIPNSNIDRKVTAILEYPAPLTVTFETLWHPLARVGPERNGWDERIEINGTNGRLELFFVKWDEPEKNPALLTFYDNTAKTAVEYRFDAVNPFDMEIAEFHAALSERRAMPPDGIDGFAVDAVIEALLASAQMKTRTAVNYRDV